MKLASISKGIVLAFIASATLSGAVFADTNSQAISNTTMSAERQMVAKALEESQPEQWSNLTFQEKNQVLDVLVSMDKLPETDEEAKRISPILAVETSETRLLASPSLSRVLSSSGSRSDWYERRWTILGISYAKATTHFGYNYNRTRVTSSNYCYGTILNLVPLRAINHHSYVRFEGNNAVCETAITLQRFGHATTYGYQGIRVNRNGIIDTWGP